MASSNTIEVVREIGIRSTSEATNLLSVLVFSHFDKASLKYVSQPGYSERRSWTVSI